MVGHRATRADASAGARPLFSRDGMSMSLSTGSVTARHSSKHFLRRLAAVVVVLDAIVIGAASLALHHSRARYEERASTAATNIAVFQERDLVSTVERDRKSVV